MRRAIHRLFFAAAAPLLVALVPNHALAQNYYWKDNQGNGQWDWGSAQWWSSSANSLVGAPQTDGGAIIWLENVGSTTTYINSGFTGGWFKLNSLYTAANSTGRNYIINMENGGTGIEIYNKIETQTGGGTLTINGAVQLGANAEINAVGGSLTLGEVRVNGKTLNSFGANSLNVTGAISGTGTYNIKNQGITVTYSGTNANTFTGATTVENSSTLVLNKSAGTNAIAGTLTINSGATLRTDAANQLASQLVSVDGAFNMNSQNQTFALAGSGTVTNNAILTNNSTGTDTFSGVISGTGAVVKANAGTNIFSGNNTYSGGTTISAGALQIGNGGASGNITGNVTNNASLIFNRSGSLSFTNFISGSGGLTISSGTVVLGNTNTFAGTVTVNSGATVSVAVMGTNTNSTTSSSLGINSASTTGKLTLNGGTLLYTGSGEYSSNRIAFGVNGGTIDASGTGALILRSASSGATAAGNTNTARTITLSGNNVMTNQNNANLTNYSSTGIVTLAKTGTGNWELGGTSTFTGGIDIFSGRIIVGGQGEITNSLGTGDLRIYNGGGIRSSSTTTRVDSTNHVYKLGGTNYIDWMDLGIVTLTNNTTIVGNTAIGGEVIPLGGGSTTTTLGSNTGIQESGGSYSLTKSGANSVLILNGANSYSGGTFVTSGTLQVTNAGALGTSSSGVTVSGGTLDLGNSTRTNGTYTLTGGAIQNGSISISTAFNYGGSGTFTGVNLSGAGYFALTNGSFSLDDRINNLTGGVRLTGGTLTLTNAANLGSGNFLLGSAGTLGILQVNTTTSATNSFVVNDSSTNTSINVASGQTFSMSGTISQTNGVNNTTKFGKDGAGTLVMAGSNGTYGGQLQIGQGTVIVGVNNALGTNVTISARGVDLGLNVGDTAQANNVSLLISNGVTFGQSIYVATNLSSATRTIGLSGAGAVGSFTNEIYQDGNLTLDAGSSTGTLTISGAIVTNNAAVAKGLIITNGTTILGNTNNTFTGGVTIGNNAILSGSLFGYATNINTALTTVLGLGTSTFKDANKLTIDGGTLKYIGAGETNYLYFKVGTNGATFDASGSGLWNLSGGSGAFVISGATDALRTITLTGTNAHTNTISAKITNGSATGLTKVVKTGTGTWNLGSSVSDYSGGTELRQGTIVITGSSDSFGTGVFQMYDGTTLTASGTTVRTNKNNNNFQLGGNLTMSWLEFSNTTLTNNTTISVVGTNSTRGSSMTFAGSGIAETGGSRSLTLNAGQGAAETNTWSTFSGANSFSGGLILGSGMSVRLTNNGTLGATNGAVNLANGSIDLGGLTRTNGALTVSTGTISNGTISASSVALTSAGSISAVLAGSGALTKSGAGTSVLSGANTYSGGTTISAGTLQGDTTSLRGAITNNANLLFVQSTDGEYAGVLSGSGALTVDGNSTAVVTVSGNNSFSGLTSFTNGTLRLGSATALGSGGSDWTTTGTRLGTGAILDLNGNNVANEALGMNSSTAYVTNSSTTTAIWGGSISLTNGTNQFNVASGKDITLNGSIVYGTASRQIMKNGDGVLTVAGSANTNSGAININAGTFRMGHATALGANSTSNDVTVASGATLDLNGYTATASIKPIKLSGTGVGANGALQNSASNTTATVNNAVVLNANSSAGGAGNITMAGSVSGASTLTKVGTGTLALGSGASASVSTIAIQQGTLLLGAANQIGNDTGITMSGGTLGMGGFNDTAGKLSVSADSIFDFGNTGAGTSTFTFNDFDTATYGGVAGLTMQNVNIGSQIVFNTNYSGNSTFNTFTTKISFSDTQLMNQISFSGGTTTLTVAAIPEPKVYVAAGALALLIGYAEVRRRRKSISSKA